MRRRTDVWMAEAAGRRSNELARNTTPERARERVDREYAARALVDAEYRRKLALIFLANAKREGESRDEVRHLEGRASAAAETLRVARVEARRAGVTDADIADQRRLAEEADVDAPYRGNPPSASEDARLLRSALRKFHENVTARDEYLRALEAAPEAQNTDRLRAEAVEQAWQFWDVLTLPEAWAVYRRMSAADREFAKEQSSLRDYEPRSDPPWHGKDRPSSGDILREDVLWHLFHNPDWDGGGIRANRNRAINPQGVNLGFSFYAEDDMAHPSHALLVECHQGEVLATEWDTFEDGSGDVRRLSFSMKVGELLNPRAVWRGSYSGDEGWSLADVQRMPKETREDAIVAVAISRLAYGPNDERLTSRVGG